MHPINECPLSSLEPDLAHSKGKPDVSTKKTSINVRFAIPFAEEIPVQIREKTGGLWNTTAEFLVLNGVELQPRARFQMGFGGTKTGL